jgi:hypothetical protein
MPNEYDWRVSLESPTGLILGTGQLNDGSTGKLGNLTTELTDSRVKIRSVSFQGGRNRELDTIPPATMTIVFDNREGIWNPEDVSGPYYGLLYPGKGIHLAYVNKVAGLYFDFAAGVFSGTVTSWTFDYDLNGDAIATVSAKDSMGRLAGINIPSTAVPAERTGARIARILTLAGLNASQYSLAQGYSTLAAGTISGDALQLVQDVAFQEQGFVYSLRSTIVFVQRNAFQEIPEFYFTNVASSPNAPAGVYSMPFSSLGVAYSDDSVANSVTTVSSLGTAVVTDAAKVLTYGKTSKSYDVSYSTFLEQTNFTNYLVTNYGAPEFRPDSMQISLDGVLELPDIFALQNVNGYTALLLASISYYGIPVLVEFAPGGSSAELLETQVISSWSHSSTPSRYDVTIGFEPATFLGVFRLDDADYGILDTNKLAF